jgi:hypothetical protein
MTWCHNTIGSAVALKKAISVAKRLRRRSSAARARRRSTSAQNSVRCRTSASRTPATIESTHRFSCAGRLGGA